MKTLSQIREASGGKEAYQKFFNGLLKKFGVSSPSELKGDKKKSFFDAIDKGWDGDNEKAEEVKEASKLKAGRGKVGIDINWDGNAAEVKDAKSKYKVTIKPHRDGAMLSGDKQKILAYLQSQDYDMDDEDIEDLYPELMESKKMVVTKIDKDTNSPAYKKFKAGDKRYVYKETYDDPDDLDPETTLNPDEDELATGKSLGEANSADLKKAQAIASKNSGDMEAAIAAIEKIRKGLSDDKKVMAMLKTANETYSKMNAHKDKDGKKLHASKKMNAAYHAKESVSVDRRTVGFKEAMKRRAEAKAKREALKIKAAKGNAKKAMDNIDANYAYDGDIDEIIKGANSRIMGETAANATGASVDMNPTGKSKKKKDDKENLMAKYGY
jgi:hypothetical protein